MTDEARDVIAHWLAKFEGWPAGTAEWENADAILAALTAAGLVLLRWRRVTPTDPRVCRVVLAMHEDDLYPVPAYRMYWRSKMTWMYERDGPEDDLDEVDHRHTELRRAPTHFAELPELLLKTAAPVSRAMTIAEHPTLED